MPVCCIRCIRPKVSYQVAYPQSRKRYRYIRYTSTPEKTLQLAELQLFRKVDDQEKIAAKVIDGSNAFIADDRVDFRQLIKVLAEVFKVFHIVFPN